MLSFLRLNHCGQRELASYMGPDDLGCLVYASSDTRRFALSQLAARGSAVAAAVLGGGSPKDAFAADDSYPWFSCVEALEALWALDKDYLRRKSTTLARQAAIHGRVGPIGHLRTSGRFVVWDLVVKVAAAHGHAEVIRYCVDTGVPMDMDRGILEARLEAAEAGHLDVIKYIFEIPRFPLGPHEHSVLIRAAAKGGFLHTIEYLLGIAGPGFWGAVGWGVQHDIAVTAIRAKSVACLRLLIDSGIRVHKTRLLEQACGAGCMDCARYLWALGGHDSVVEAAARAIHGGHLDALEFLVYNGLNLGSLRNDPSLQHCLRKVKDVRLFKYVHDRGFRMDEHSLCNAIQNGAPIEVLRYMCEHGCPISPPPFNIKYTCQPVELYRLLVAHGYPFDARAILETMLDCKNIKWTPGYDDAMTYLHELAEEDQRRDRG